MLCKTGSSWASLPTGLHVRTDIREAVESITVAGLANADLRSPQWNKALFFSPRLALDQSSPPPSVRKALTSPCPNTDSVAWADCSPLSASLWSLCAVCSGQRPVFDSIVIPTSRSNLHMHTVCGSKGSWLRKGLRCLASVPRFPWYTNEQHNAVLTCRTTHE